jgi:hypothetical protein
VSPEQRPAHSPLGASGAERWMSCPGSVNLIKQFQLPESDEPEYRSWGTSAHEAGYTALRDNLEAWELVGQTFGKHVVDTEMSSCIQEYMDECHSIIGEGGTTHLEFGIDAPDFHPDFYGTLDFGYVNDTKEELDVVDFKTGIGVAVDVEWNPQIMYYAYGLLRHYPTVKRVKFTIVQPRAFHPDGTIRKWELDADALRTWATDTLLPAMNRTALDHDLDAGPHCRFCTAKLICPLMTSLFGAAMTLDPKLVPQLNDKSIGRSYRYISAVKSYIKALSEEVMRRNLTGQTVPGTKLVNKKADRVWKDGALGELSVAYPPDEIFTQPELKSPAQIEKLGANAKKLVAKLAYTPMTGFTVAGEDDKRPAVVVQQTEEKFKVALANLTAGADA